MKKYILLLLLLLPPAAFGQSFEGHYKAVFAAAIGGKVKTEAEFQIHPGGGVSGQLISGDVIIAIQGQVDYLGALEAKSERRNNAVYTLKVNLKEGNKINLFSRFEENSGGSLKVSQSMAQGNYAKIEKTDEQSSKSDFSGKSELWIEQPHPLSDKVFSNYPAEVRVIKEDFVNVYHFQMISEAQGQNRAFYFAIARAPDSEQKVWKIENIRFLRYIEKTDDYAKVNNFFSDYETWKKNRETTGGQIELLKSSAQQMVFKITNLKIKNIAGSEIATVNGTVYAEICK